MCSPKYPVISYIYMEVNYQSFFSSFEKMLPQDYGIIIKNSKDEVLFSNNYSDPAITDLIIQSSDFLTDNDQTYVSLSTQYTLGEIQFFCLKKDIFAKIRQILQFAFFGFWIVLTILGVLGFFLSSLLVKPIEQLTKNMLEVEKGTLKATVTTNRKDEVGVLIQSFNKMIGQLKYLIEVAYESELEKKEYQMKLLYAQINPHFLYNVLSLINSQAIINGQDEISHLALLITTFYRTSLNHGKDEISVENELKNISSYIEIQQTLHGGVFEFSIHADPSVLAFLIPHFILQPIVENAIEHGLLHSKKKNKQLHITVEEKENYIVLMVFDNGIGISPNQSKNLFNEESEGYGLVNIDKRLSLIYGKSYSVKVESTLNKNTLVILELPKTLDNLS